MKHYISVLMIGACLMSTASHAKSLCTFEHIATIPLTETGYTISLQAHLEGHPLSLIVDTGSEGSLLTPEALIRLRLTPDNSFKTLISGSDGRGQIVPNVTIKTLEMGNLLLSNLSFPVGALPGAPLIRPAISGLIGMNLLGNYDLDFDLPHHQLTLYHIQLGSMLCKRPPAWQESEMSGANKSNKQNSGKIKTLHTQVIARRYMIPFILDGHKGTALLDSGAHSHIVSLSFAHKLGLNEERLAQDPGGYSASIATPEKRYYWHQFSELKIGDEVRKKPTLTVAPLKEHADMLLGADWFQTHRVWISKATERVYIHP
ncbi:hypothetical protein GT348_07560 [Aristophania vespae]|uniref:Peptidase A2 domain-containing protein n=1 Tax=Aristophania vespae TaxID=2697033 RepID=A0A6P1NMP1_9PROT|nr:retroviral-like aspartic protease family protein [Aristophania vespae]QHI96111.1 hypothetical protein GT348_07560 [Aristophania vespae]UMM63882.1 hypothetical protein DM15PD_08600 [Aristophania vespae]